MGNARMYYGTNIPGTQIATNEDSTKPIGNAFTDNKKKPFRTTVITESSITFDMLVITEIFGIILFNHSQPGTLFIFEGSNDNFSTTPGSETIPITSINSLLNINWSYRYYRIRMTASTGSYMQIGEIFLSLNAYTFPKNFKTLHGAGNVTSAIIKKSPESGRIIKKVLFTKYFQKYSFETVEKAQALVLSNINGFEYVVYQPDSEVDTEFYFGINNFELPDNISNSEYKNLGAEFEESL